MLHPAGDSLRLVDPTEGVLSSADVVTGFAQLATTWVWNSDRTRAFVFPTTVLSGAPTTPLGNGTYRIAWGFARNAAGAPVLRRTGKDTAEQAVTQFPLT